MGWKIKILESVLHGSYLMKNTMIRLFVYLFLCILSLPNVLIILLLSLSVRCFMLTVTG